MGSGRIAQCERTDRVRFKAGGAEAQEERRRHNRFWRRVGVNGYYRCWAEIDLSALRENLSWLRQRVGLGVKILTVVKADAYGHGIRPIAGLLMQSGTDLFGVANLSEAEAIRNVGKGWPTLMLGACLPAEVERAIEIGVMPTISSFAEAQAFSEVAVRRGAQVKLHVKVDTGMGRLGVPCEKARALIREIQLMPGVQSEGIYTHYASAEDEPEFSRKQREDFHAVLGELRQDGICPPLVHANNSAAVLCEPGSDFNVIRPGLLVYGVTPPGSRDYSADWISKLRPALSFYCRVGMVKRVKAGTRLSYGGTYVAPREIRVATLTAGYGDGYLRSGSNRAQVLIGGRRCQVLGRITMDQMLVDVSEVESVEAGDPAVLIGWQRDERISVNEVAGWSGTVPWEVFTSITYRVPRIYRGGQAS